METQPPFVKPANDDVTDLFDDTARFIARFIAAPQVVIDTMAIWAMHTYIYDRYMVTPYLAILSPTKGSGKTTALDVLALLSAGAMRVSGQTEASLCNYINAKTAQGSRITLMLDELDANNRSWRQLRGILNDGARKGGGLLKNIHAKGIGGGQKRFNVFCPKALSGIGYCLPDTVMDRSIVLPIMRKMKWEVTEPFDMDDENIKAQAEILRGHLNEFKKRYIMELDRYPDLPDGLSNRQADLWRPLFAIALKGGGDMPERIENAWHALSPDEDMDPGVALLADIKAVFDLRGTDTIGTTQLLKSLRSLDDGDRHYDGPALRDGGHLSRALRPFGVAPEPNPFRIEGKLTRGYRIDVFTEVFERYLD